MFARVSTVVPLHSGWQIVSGPSGLDGHDFDGAAWSWIVEGRGERSEVIVHVPGCLLGTPAADLPERVAAAISSHGRSELEWICALPGKPPKLVDFGAGSEQPVMVPPLPLAA